MQSDVTSLIVQKVCTKAAFVEVIFKAVVLQVGEVLGGTDGCFQHTRWITEPRTLKDRERHKRTTRHVCKQTAQFKA